MDKERALIKSKEIYFHKTLSYIEKLSDKVLENEEEKIKNEFKLKKEFLNKFDKVIE